MNIKKRKIELLDCQVELVLKSLEFYAYTYKFVYPRKKSLTKEENLRISFVNDTYEQILSEYTEKEKQKEKGEIKILKNLA